MAVLDTPPSDVPTSKPALLKKLFPKVSVFTWPSDRVMVVVRVLGEAVVQASGGEGCADAL